MDYINKHELWLTSGEWPTVGRAAFVCNKEKYVLCLHI